jgi:hypothetical protein
MDELNQEPVSTLPPNVENFLVELFAEPARHKLSNRGNRSKGDKNKLLVVFPPDHSIQNEKLRRAG